MALFEETLYGKTDKVQRAIDILRSFEPPEGYFLAFSGGKDSQCVYHLAKMAGVKFDAHYSVTSVDPPELCRFIKKITPMLYGIITTGTTESRSTTLRTAGRSP